MHTSSRGLQFSTLHQHHSHRQLPAVGQAQLHSLNSHHSRQFGRPSAQMERGLSARLPLYLKLLPADPTADPRPQCLRSRLLRCKPRRKALSRILFSYAVGNLSHRKDTLQKPLSESLHTLLHPPRFDQIRPQPKHHSLTSHLHPPTLHARSRKISTKDVVAIAYPHLSHDHGTLLPPHA